MQFFKKIPLESNGFYDKSSQKKKTRESSFKNWYKIPNILSTPKSLATNTIMINVANTHLYDSLEHHNNFKALQPIEGQGLPADYWPHIHLSADTGERPSGLFRVVCGQLVEFRSPVGFLDQDYHWKSVAAQIPHGAWLAPVNHYRGSKLELLYARQWLYLWATAVLVHVLHICNSSKEKNFTKNLI